MERVVAVEEARVFRGRVAVGVVVLATVGFVAYRASRLMRSNQAS